MKLSEELEQLDKSGDVGRAVEGMAERVRVMEDELLWLWYMDAMRWCSTFEEANEYASQQLTNLNDS